MSHDTVFSIRKFAHRLSGFGQTKTKNLEWGICWIRFVVEQPLPRKQIPDQFSKLWCWPTIIFLFGTGTKTQKGSNHWYVVTCFSYFCWCVYSKTPEWGPRPHEIRAYNSGFGSSRPELEVLRWELSFFEANSSQYCSMGFDPLGTMASVAVFSE